MTLQRNPFAELQTHFLIKHIDSPDVPHFVDNFRAEDIEAVQTGEHLCSERLLQTANNGASRYADHHC